MFTLTLTLTLIQDRRFSSHFPSLGTSYAFRLPPSLLTRITSYHLVSPRITSHYLALPRLYIYTHTYTNAHPHIYPHIPAHTHTYTHTYTHTHSYTRTPRMQRTHIRKVSQATDRLKAQKVGWRAEEKEGWKEKGKKTTF